MRITPPSPAPKRARGPICVRGVGQALKAYLELNAASQLLEIGGDIPKIRDHVLNVMLSPPQGAGDYFNNVKLAAAPIHPIARTLCRRNGKTIRSQINQAKIWLRKNQISAARKQIDAAAIESSRCGATIIEFCAPMTVKRKKELTRLAAPKK